MRGATKFSNELTKKVLQTAQKIGYNTNFAARNLATNHSGIIGIYAHNLHDAVRSELVNHLVIALNTAEYKPVLGLSEGAPSSWHKTSWVKTFRQLNVDALVVVAEDVTNLPKWINDIPTIFMGCHPKPSACCDYVALDRKDAICMIAEETKKRRTKALLVAKENSLKKTPYG